MRIIQEALTFDDVLLAPDYSEVLPREASLATMAARGIELNIPVLSAAMDTVTESALAIALAQEGGLGVIHKNMTPERQAWHVAAVKKYASGVVSDPITVSPDKSVREVLEITRGNNISGLPVEENGRLLGIVTNRDLRFETHLERPVREVMTPEKRLVTVGENPDEEEVLTLLHKHRIEKVLVVDENFQLKGLITAKDFQKASDFPRACKDRRGALRVGAAVGAGADTEQRAALLSEAGADVLVVDTAHGHSRGVIERVAWLRKNYPDMRLIAGNVVSGEGAEALIEAGVDGVKAGVGPGSICTTRIVAGVGVPQITAVAEVASAAARHDVPVIADGGVRYSGDIAKALAAGAHCAMIGSLFAGTEEAPGDVELYQGRSYKSYRGMGSLGAMSQQYGSSDRYQQDSTEQLEKLVPEGIEGRVPYKGSLVTIVRQLIGGLQAAMGYTGCASVEELRSRARFVRITAAGIKESHVHDVTITKEAPNYRGRA
ncbi:IMP dehydrogenase [Candidatus Foliamicus sp.]